MERRFLSTTSPTISNWLFLWLATLTGSLSAERTRMARGVKGAHMMMMMMMMMMD